MGLVRRMGMGAWGIGMEGSLGGAEKTALGLTTEYQSTYLCYFFYSLEVVLFKMFCYV